MHQANTKNRCVGASLRNASARFFSSGLEGMHKGPRAKLADYYKESEVGQSNLHPRGGFFIHAILTKDFLSVLLIIVKLTILDKQLRNPKGERRRKEICTAISCRMAEAAQCSGAYDDILRRLDHYKVPPPPAAAHPLSFPIFGRTTKHISASCCTASPLFKAAGGSENGQPAQTTRNFRRTMCFKQRKKEGGILTWVKANTL